MRASKNFWKCYKVKEKVSTYVHHGSLEICLSVKKFATGLIMPNESPFCERGCGGSKGFFPAGVWKKWILGKAFLHKLQKYPPKNGNCKHLRKARWNLESFKIWMSFWVHFHVSMSNRLQDFVTKTIKRPCSEGWQRKSFLVFPFCC